MSPHPQIVMTPEAARAIQQAGSDSPEDVLHLEISSAFQYDLYFAPVEVNDTVVQVEGIKIALDRESYGRANDVRIDFVQNAGRAGFEITSPHDPPRVKQITPKQLVAMLSDGEPLLLLDVRTPHEQELASLPNARLFQAAVEQEVLAMPHDTRIVFQCHHGGRSQNAAQRFVMRGFRNVYNLAGGIDAWSLEVDATVPRY